MTQNAEKAAKRFFEIIAPGESWDYTDHPAKRLARAAFALYEQEWRSMSPGISIGGWEWPFKELESGGQFAGAEPWTVLLREAVNLADRIRSRRKTA